MRFPLVAYLALASHVLPLGSGLVWLKRLPRGMRLFFVFVVVNALSEYITFAMGRLHLNNLGVLHVDHLLECVLLSLVLLAWQDRPWARLTLKAGIIVFTAVWIVAQFSVEPLNEPDLYTHTLECLFLIFMTVATLLQVARTSSVRLIRSERLWITTGLLVYFAGDFLLYLFWNEIVSLGPVKAAGFWTINWSVNILVNVMYAVALYLGRR